MFRLYLPSCLSGCLFYHLPFIIFSSFYQIWMIAVIHSKYKLVFLTQHFWFQHLLTVRTVASVGHLLLYNKLSRISQLKAAHAYCLTLLQIRSLVVACPDPLLRVTRCLQDWGFSPGSKSSKHVVVGKIHSLAALKLTYSASRTIWLHRRPCFKLDSQICFLAYG